MAEKYKLVMSSDMILSYSGVANQARFIADHLIKTGKFKIIHLGAAMKHAEKRPGITKEWGEDLIIVPVEQYAPPEVVRQILDAEKPDAIWLMTDPRFYQDFFMMENEVHQQCPILWNTIWDNYPPPLYNKHFYEATDFLGCINKLTYDIMCQMGFSNKAKYIPHGVPENDFTIMNDDEIMKSKITLLGQEHKNSFIIFYNSRNAMRKRTGNVIMAFKEFLEMITEKERNETILLMNTPVGDPEGQDLNRILDDFGLRGKVVFAEKTPLEKLKEFYNIANLTVNVSSEEGFGLSCLESLMCGTPAVVNRTGGLQDQIVDPETKKVFGKCLEPDAKTLIGSQNTPYIWSDNLDPTTVAKAFKELHDDWKSDKINFKNKWAGFEARENMLKRFNLKNVVTAWEENIIQTIEDFKRKKESKKVTYISI